LNGPITNRFIFCENVHDQTLDPYRTMFHIIKSDD
jgi:hypothetical protein